MTAPSPILTEAQAAALPLDPMLAIALAYWLPLVALLAYALALDAWDRFRARRARRPS